MQREINPHGRLLVFIASVVWREFLYAHTHVLYAPHAIQCWIYLWQASEQWTSGHVASRLFLLILLLLSLTDRRRYHNNTCALLFALCFSSNRIIWWIEMKKSPTPSSQITFAVRRAGGETYLLLMKGTLQPDLYFWNSLLSDSVDFNNLFEIITNLLVCA